MPARFALLLALALAVLACGSPPTPPRRATPSATVSVPPKPTATRAVPTATAVPSPTPTAVPSTPVPQPNIVVAAPSSGDLIQSPVYVAGRARVFEATVEIEVMVDGRVLGRTFTTASAGAPDWGTFSAPARFEPPAAAGPGLVRVFSRSAKDGTVQDLVEVPVRVLAPATSTAMATPLARRLTIYFAQTRGNDVTFVPVGRDWPDTTAVGRAAIEELLKGPTAAEKAAGLYSPIPEGTALLSLRIADGTATADFDRRLQEGVGGSVRVMSIRRVVELTLRQFSTVQKVVISVEGRTEGVLQP